MKLLPFISSTAFVLAVSGCGPTDAMPAEGPLDLRLGVSAGLLDVLSAFQVSLVTAGSTLDCVSAQKACIKSQVDQARFVTLKDTAGTSHKGLLVPLELVAGTPTTQDLTLKGLTLGKDFALVVEALTKDTPPRLAASSCNYVKQLSVGTNTTVIAHLTTLSPAVSCDPRLDP